MAAPGAAAAGGGEEAEEQTEFDVVLTAAGDKKIQVIKEVRALTSLGLKEAKDLVDGAPNPVLEKVTKEAADKAKEQIESAGRLRRDQVTSEPRSCVGGALGSRPRRLRPLPDARRGGVWLRCHNVPAFGGATRMGDAQTFGQRLRATRTKAGLSQSDLEVISGIPKARLSRYENGHVAPSIQTLERLARALNVSEATLLDDGRAVVEEFLKVLLDRGVKIESSEQAVALGNAVADMVKAIGSEHEGAKESNPSRPLAAATTVREWLDGRP
jgi:transcriptional regulator with XRE-family HTH domain